MGGVKKRIDEVSQAFPTFHRRFPVFFRDSFKALKSSRLANKGFENCPAPGTSKTPHLKAFFL